MAGFENAAQGFSLKIECEAIAVSRWPDTPGRRWTPSDFAEEDSKTTRSGAENRQFFRSV